MTDIGQAALAFAELGYQVFPCAADRNPAPLTPQGFKNATTDADQIQRWWRRYPGACIGIATEGLLVVDIDAPPNPWLSDQPELAADLLSAPTSITPGGGRHHFFRRPAGKDWKCTVGRLAAHVDTRTDGGYVVVPPSVRPDGEYRWIEGCELDSGIEGLPEPPGWLVAKLDALTWQPAATGAMLTQAGCNVIPSGQRNATLARLGGAMRRVGMGQAEILAALQQTNAQRCVPPIPDREVERIAASVSRYEPDQISVAVAEDHHGQAASSTGGPSINGMAVPGGRVDLSGLMESHRRGTRSSEDHLPIQTYGQLIRDFPQLRKPVIDGLLREGETMNVIASPKVGKSWLVTDLAIAVATGGTWLDQFICEPGNVLIIDNELHCETSANRLPKVARARGVADSKIADQIHIANIRGCLRDIHNLKRSLEGIAPETYKVIILDAFYRFMPRDTDENDNGAMANIYNDLDNLAAKLKCSFVLVHHSSKGNQSGKSVTDVGAGAGSQSRATDTHFVLRPHTQDGVVVLDAVVRSWRPVDPLCLRWAFPVWTPDWTLDPSELKQERPRKAREPKSEAEPKPALWDVDRFVETFISEEPVTKAKLRELAKSEPGLSWRRITDLCEIAEEDGKVHRWQVGKSHRVMFSTVPQPKDEGSK